MHVVHVFVCFIQSQPSLKWMPLQIWNADDFFFQEGKGSGVYCSLPGEGGGGLRNVLGNFNQIVNLRNVNFKKGHPL